MTALSDARKHEDEANRLITEVLDDTGMEMRLMRHEIVSTAQVHATLALANYTLHLAEVTEDHA